MNRQFGRGPVVALGALLLLIVAAPARTDGDEPPKTPARKAVERFTPEVPGSVVAAMQEAKYADAAQALDKLAKDAKDDSARAFYRFLRGTALRLDGKLDSAREVLSGALKDAPKGPWAAKIRSELAAVEVAAGKFEAAETLARAEADSLLSDDRKDRLAAVYRGFADRLLKPDLPTVPADPEGAYALLAQARALAKGQELRASLLFAMGRASQAAGNPGRAITDYQTYLKEYPKGADRTAARFELGQAQSDSGQALPARLTWTDLARDLEKADTKDASDYRARALYGIAKTHGVPSPPDDAQLGLGVAALRKLVSAYPSHRLAVRAQYEIAESYRNRGKSQEALDAYLAFLKSDDPRGDDENARRDRAELLMAAQFQVGQILFGQQKFDEAIAAFKGYLAKYPNGPQSADAQRAILDVQFAAAYDLFGKQKFEEARKAFLAFISANPLDGRIPQLLYDVGRSYAEQKKYDDAITAWDVLAGKFPNTEASAHTLFSIGLTLENDKGDPVAAIDRYRKVTVEPWASQARQHIAVMEAKALTVVTERAFRSGETPKLKISTRNIGKLTFTAYKIDPETYFRKKHTLSGVEGLDIGLVAPDTEWTAEVPGYAKYKPIETTYDLKKLEIPAVWVVKVTDEKTLQATTLVLGTDLDAIVKTSREQVLVYVQDMKTGKPRPKARVLLSDDTGVILDARTGEDGVLLTDWGPAVPAGAETPVIPLPAAADAPLVPPPAPPGDNVPAAPKPCADPDARPAEPQAPAVAPAAPAGEKPHFPQGQLRYLVLDGPSAAGSGLDLPQKVAQGLNARAYIYTDRPAYRPGDDVALRGVVREVSNGQYANEPGAKYKLEVYDSKGRRFLDREVTLSEYGTFHAGVALDDAAPVGTYRVRLFRPNRSEFSGEFEVQAYHLEKIDLDFDLPKTVYFRGETIKGTLIARYQYGTPLAGRPIAVALPDGRILEGKTDEEGKYKFELETTGFAEEQALHLQARLPQDNVAAAATVSLAVRGFRIDLSTTRDVYLDGENFVVNLATIDAKGDPTGQTLAVALVKKVNRNGQVVEREVSRGEVKTDPKTGKASIRLKADDEEGGDYLVRALGTDQFGNAILGEKALTISGKQDQTKLRLLTDRTSFKVGEKAEVRLLNRGPSGPALLTWEADRVLSYKIVPLKEGENSLAWDVEGPQFPNFTLSAAKMAPPDLHEARLDVKVERDLRVTVKPARPEVKPGEEVEVEVTTTDQNGQPASAELSLALVDRSLLRLFADKMPPIAEFFYNQTRTSAFATESSATFRYAPPTVPVPEAVVEAEAQDAARLAEADRKAGAMKEADKLANMYAVQAPQAAAAMAAPGPAGGMGGNQNAPADRPAEAKSEAGMMFGGRAGGRSAALGLEAARRDLGDAEAAESLEDLSKDMAGKKVARSRRGYARAKAGAGFGFTDVAALGENAAPRERFAETAYWNPSVVTGKDGKATVKFRAPAALSEYRFTARGVTGSTTLVGQSGADLAVRKSFFVDLKTPASLTQGDRPRFTAEVHHKRADGPATLRLTIYAGGREVVQPKRLTLKGDGVEEVMFDAFDVPDGDEVRLTLNADSGDLKDELTTAVPIRPWGVEAVASASGSSTDDVTAFVELPPGREYSAPEMLITLAPSLRRMLVELALGNSCFPYPIVDRARIAPPFPNTTADRAGDLLAAASILDYLRATKASEADEASRLTDRMRGLVAELITLQNEDGGWPWVASSQQRPSDRMTSARVVWALSAAEKLGVMPDPNVLNKGATWLGGEFAKIDGSDHEARATVLHALSTRGKASFEQANALNRIRQGLNNVSLAYLAMTFANLDRKSLGDEVLGILAPRGKTEPAEPGHPARRYWSGQGQGPWHRSDVETTALAADAFAQVRPQSPDLSGAVAWLEVHRSGMGWIPPKAKGPSLAALGSFYGSARGTQDRYRLVVTVNDNEVHKADVTGNTESAAIRVPRRFLKEGGKNRVKFDIEGRGRFGYSVTLTGFTREFGPDQDAANRSFWIDRRVYWPDTPTIDGTPISQGFSVAVNAQTWENTVTQVKLGGKVTIAVGALRSWPQGVPSWDHEYLVLREYVPAGATVVEGSIRTAASHYTIEDNMITAYFSPDQSLGIIYDVYGYMPGTYRALPASLSSAYEPGKRHLGKPSEFKVLAPGEKNTDTYKVTPDELFARGKYLFEHDRLAEAAEPLKALWTGYGLRDDVAKEAARMLLTISIKEYNPRDVVVYFEVLKEKDPDRVISFDDIKVVGRAYGELGEHERAYLVWRATTEASYLEDARVGSVLRQRGRTLEAISYLLDLWREYPSTASIQSDFLGLAQLVASLAGKATTDPALRTELIGANATRSDLLLQAIRLDQAFLAMSPKDPQADEASLALVGAYLDLEDFGNVVKLSRRFAELYPKSNFLDSFQYSEALGRFNLGEYDRAIQVAETIANATYKDANGVDQPSPNKWQAVYILGQIYDARRQPAKALDYYRRVADRFTDAAGAIKALTRKELKLPEVSVIRPDRAEVTEAGGLRAMPAQKPDEKKDGAKSAKLEYRNIATADVKVYPVDLMRLYLTRRNLDAIAGIDLAGIKPFYEETVKLGDGQDFDDKVRSIDLPVKKEGAYLVMIRGDDRYTSGILLVSPLELQVLEEPESGRVRVRVIDAISKAPMPKVQVKVIGNENPTFLSGETDLRGVFVAEGVRGQVTAVARKGTNEYAFHRGKVYVGAPPVPAAPNAPGQPAQGQAGEPADLQMNVRSQNTSNQMQQIQRLEQRYEKPDAGVKAKSAY